MLPDEVLSYVAPAAGEPRTASAGKTVVAQGDTGDTVLVVAEGEVELLLPGVPPVTLDRRGPGTILGAERALSEKPAPYAIIAATDVKLLPLDGPTLLRLSQESPAFSRHLLHLTLTSLSAVTSAAQSMHARTNLLESHIARKVDDAHGELLGESHAMQTLRAEIARLGDSEHPVLIIGEPGVGKQLAGVHLHLGGRRRSETFLTLNAAEWREDLWRDKVVMAAGGTILIRSIDKLPPGAASAVGEFCTKAAPDKPRLIATLSVHPGSAPELPWPWAEAAAIRIPPLRERKADIPELARAFLREQNAVYGATDEPITSDAMRLLIAYPYLGHNLAELKGVISHAAHLAMGGPIRPEHVRLGVREHHPGRPIVGLALGGGVVRGMAHVGVLQVLQEERIPIDMIAGTSVGSMVGAIFAGGMDLSELERIAPTLSWPKLVGPVWPGQGLLTNAKLGRFVETLIGRKRVEELPISYAAVAVDRDSGQEVILREGMVAEAVRASTAIPGLFKPVTRGPQHLIDGGLVNNVPASVVRSMGADVVIAVDVRDYNYFAPEKEGGLMLSFLRAYDIMINRAASSELEWADVPIRATYPGANPYGFKMAGQLIEAGRQEARKALPAIREALRRAEQVAKGKAV